MLMFLVSLIFLHQRCLDWVPICLAGFCRSMYNYHDAILKVRGFFLAFVRQKYVRHMVRCMTNWCILLVCYVKFASLGLWYAKIYVYWWFWHAYPNHNNVHDGVVNVCILVGFCVAGFISFTDVAITTSCPQPLCQLTTIC